MIANLTFDDALAVLHQHGVSVEALGQPEGYDCAMWRLDDHVAFDAGGVIARAYRVTGARRIIRRLDPADSARIACLECTAPDGAPHPHAEFSITTYPSIGHCAPWFTPFCAEHTARWRAMDDTAEVSS